MQPADAFPGLYINSLHQNAFASGTRFRTPLRQLTALSQTLSWI